MKQYKVLVTSTASGWTDVMANSPEEAEIAAGVRVENEGGSCIYDTTHYETSVVGQPEEL